MKFTTDELIIIEKLIIKNRDNKKLQDITGLSYIDSISLLNKVRKMLGRLTP